MPQDKTTSGGALTPFDQFAMAALTRIYAAQRDTAQAGAGGHNPAGGAAKMAYEAALAMMKERQKRA